MCIQIRRWNLWILILWHLHLKDSFHTKFGLFPIFDAKTLRTKVNSDYRDKRNFKQVSVSDQIPLISIILFLGDQNEFYLMRIRPEKNEPGTRPWTLLKDLLICKSNDKFPILFILISLIFDEPFRDPRSQNVSDPEHWFP